MGAANSTEKECILETSRGALRGVEYTNASSQTPLYRRYTRIPYALPPVGPLRWRRPQRLSKDFSFNNKSASPGDFTTFGPVSPQPFYDLSKAELDNPSAGPTVQNQESEDCLYLNIWVPVGRPPDNGWPIQVYIHGGWLQVGDAMQNNKNDPFDLYDSNQAPRIIVSPTYRLNLFGFLSGPALVEIGEEDAPGNYGFWDQRLALEWIHENIGLFGGNKDNITVGGLSAGANSTFFQLFYDSRLPKENRIIKRVYLWSNAVGVQPDSISSAKISRQFDELAEHFSITPATPSAEKLEKLRSIPSEDLVNAISKLKLHTFRATTDDSFIPLSFLSSIHDGSFTAKLNENGTTLMIGEVSDEGLLYRITNPPTSYRDLVVQLCNYYPEHVVQALLKLYPIPSKEHPTEEDWADIFGKIAADCQVYATERGFINSLISPPVGEGLTVNAVFRYKVSWRAKSLDSWINPKVGVCHAADSPIWWYSGFRAGYTSEDKDITRKFLEPFGKFINGDPFEWGTRKAEEIRELCPEGRVRIVMDEYWDRGQEIWKTMRQAQLS